MSEFGPIDDYRDLFENAPCGYLTIGSDGCITKVNATLTVWTGFEADKFVGRRLHQFLNMAGRIYYETHIAPLLRMQGFFHEFQGWLMFVASLVMLYLLHRLVCIVWPEKVWPEEATQP